ncbi:hypothetical protein GYMLUDRAFT_248257 [Collybiopsis luxurians FD-317 M1]|uniref:Uncharacterized protein n=1 Tax=Collybiopsis luxurians FD-317 M1 TaxID=944289 RepID=A0A0D0C129_9AGAR|nr:hypothetical protein GYMLUDRAFT_248257 [Collybiopsis luxurians FD-317 M1]
MPEDSDGPIVGWWFQNSSGQNFSQTAVLKRARVPPRVSVGPLCVKYSNGRDITVEGRRSESGSPTSSDDRAPLFTFSAPSSAPIPFLNVFCVVADLGVDDVFVTHRLRFRGTDD